MALGPRFVAVLLVLTPLGAHARATSGPVEQFDAAVAGLSLRDSSPDEARNRVTRSAADFEVGRRLNIAVDFPGDVPATMYSGLLHGEAAVFTRSGQHLDATVMRKGNIEVVSFDASTAPAAGLSPTIPARTSPRVRRSVGPGHFEDPAAYNLHFFFLKHDDLADRTLRELHANYVAWWLADFSLRVLPVEPIRITYAERASWLTSMPYGRIDSLDNFERMLKFLDHEHNFDMDRTYKRKYVLLTAERPMPGTAGVAFEGGNEAIASVAGLSRIVAHEIGHMLGATHEQAEIRGWWGCDTNMVPNVSTLRGDCLEYSSANRRAIRSYMRHGPNLTLPRRMADAPAPE